MDAQDPTIPTLGDITVNADSGVCTYESSQLTTPAAADNCSVASVVASPVSLALGANTVTWTATDGSGNTATSTQIVTVTSILNIAAFDPATSIRCQSAETITRTTTVTNNAVAISYSLDSASYIWR